MSHIGKQPITLPSGVTASQQGQVITIKGPKGELSFTVHRDIAVTVAAEQLTCAVVRKSKKSAALWGTTRARLANMVTGVTTGFRRQLELQGVGYRAALKGNQLEMTLGFSHPVQVTAPAGIAFTVAKELITVEGIDKQVVGQVAADIRAQRPPEPYKGKGIRYLGEHVRRKVGKVVGTTGA